MSLATLIAEREAFRERQAKGLTAEELQRHLRINPYMCPCCRKQMRAPKARLGGHRASRPIRTRGHLLPNLPSNAGVYRRFIYQCFVCNGDQAAMTFYGWLQYLVWKRDPRAPYVFQTLMALLELGVNPEELQ